jgi:hypothetical protein
MPPTRIFGRPLPVTVPVTSVTPSRAQREPAPVDRIATSRAPPTGTVNEAPDPRREARFASRIGSRSRRREFGRRLSRKIRRSERRPLAPTPPSEHGGVLGGLEPSSSGSGPVGLQLTPSPDAAQNALCARNHAEASTSLSPCRVCRLATRRRRAGLRLPCRVWEKQKRGMAHLHGVVSVESPAHRRWAEAYINALQELAPRYGFGFVDGCTRSGASSGPAFKRPRTCRATSLAAGATRHRSRRTCSRATCPGS